MSISRQRWADPASDRVAYARAGGRARYNGVRKARAELRRAEVVRLIGEAGGLHRGTQAAIARRLGVNDSTISRDIPLIFEGSRPERCVLCGCGEV